MTTADMKLLAFACLFVLSGCASLASDDAMDRDIQALQSADMEAAIRAAQPGVPR